MAIIIKDTDTELEIILINEAEAPIDLTNVTGMVISVFQKGLELDKFSKNTQTGYRPIEYVAPLIDGKIKIYINAEELRKGVNGFDVFYEVKHEIANTNFDGNTKEISTGPVLLGKLENSKLINKTFS